MFIAEKYSDPVIGGYVADVARQGRASLAERRLARTLIWFHPTLAKVTIRLPRLASMPSPEELRLAWERQGAPLVHRLGVDECVLFGKILNLHRIPNAGWETADLRGDTLTLCFRKKADVAIEQALMKCFWAEQTQQRARAFYDSRFRDVVAKPPVRIIAKKLGARILGQCTFDGEIRIDPRHALWPEEVLLSTLAHELTHLVHFDHSTAFWKEQTRLLPDWLPMSLMMPSDG